MEMLAVMAIIVMLMGVGLYWMGNARKLATLTSCTRNLEALAIMITGYRSDHRGSFPKPYDSGLATAANNYGTQVFTSSDAVTQPYIGDKLFPQYGADPRIFFCPVSRLEFTPTLWYKNTDGTWHVPPGSYWTYTYLAFRTGTFTDQDIQDGRVIAECCTKYSEHPGTSTDRSTPVLYSDFSVKIEPKFKW